MIYLSEVAKILDAKLQGDDGIVSALNTDTRELVAGELFIALKGEQFDGHDFLSSACERKAAGVIVSRALDLPIPSIQVADTRIALGKIAAHHRRKFQLPIIAVTGSCGKTTTKTMIASILSKMGNTLAPVKSFNNDVGVPLTLLQLNDAHQYAVIEMGANHHNEIAYLSRLTAQSVSVITNVAPAHLAGFGSLAGVARAKGEIYENLSEEGVAIVNMDDQFADYWQRIIPSSRVLTFGIKSKADVFATNITLDEEGKASFDLNYPDGNMTIQLPLLGSHNVMNALAAIAATYPVSVNKEAIQRGLSEVTPVAKRLVKYKGFAGALIIDDTYNANPLSVSAALDILARDQSEKIFVFGDMGELGEQEEKLHIAIGEKAKNLGINKLFACGNLAQLTVAAFGKNGSHFKDQTGLIHALKQILHPNMTVLVKGSRAARMENIVQAIIQEN